MSASLRRHLLASLVMPIGAVAVLGAVVVMNETSEGLEKKEAIEGTAIDVAPPPKKKPKKPKVKKSRPKPRKASRAPPPPSLAALTGGLGGISVEIPGLAFEGSDGDNASLLGAGDDVAHTSDTVDDVPEPRRQAQPGYPAAARKKGITGYVLMSVLIDKNGNVSQVKVLESNPPGVFDQASREAILKWTFNPGRYKGEAVQTWVEQQFTYNLSN